MLFLLWIVHSNRLFLRFLISLSAFDTVLSSIELSHFTNLHKDLHRVDCAFIFGWANSVADKECNTGGQPDVGKEVMLIMTEYL